LKAYRASRWSAIGLIGDPAQKTVLDEAGFLMEGFTDSGEPCLAVSRRYVAYFPLRPAVVPGAVKW
jgi:hypothetical protein